MKQVLYIKCLYLLMIISNMSLDKFGRRHAGRYRIYSVPPVSSGSLARTLEGDINVENVKITNLKLPTKDVDATTKGYVDHMITDNKKYVDKQIQGILRSAVDYTDTTTKGYVDRVITDNKKYVEELFQGVLRSATEYADATTKSYADRIITDNKKYVDEQIQGVLRRAIDLLAREIDGIKTKLKVDKKTHSVDLHTPKKGSITFAPSTVSMIHDLLDNA